MSAPQSSSTPQYFQTMSSVPHAPKPSNPPPSLPSGPQTTPPAPSTKPSHNNFPKPKLRLELRDLSHPSTEVFLSNIKPASDFAHLVDTVLRLLYTVPASSSTSTYSTDDTSTNVTNEVPLSDEHQELMKGPQSVDVEPYLQKWLDHHDKLLRANHPLLFTCSDDFLRMFERYIDLSEAKSIAHEEMRFPDIIDRSRNFIRSRPDVMAGRYRTAVATQGNTSRASDTTDHPSTTTINTTSTATRPIQPTLNIPQTRSVTLILRDLDGVAYTTGLDLDDDHKEIHLSLSYITHVSKSNSKPPTDAAVPNSSNNPIRHELLGVLCHELVHCFQYNGKGAAPSGLIEGIADWVRLNAGYVPPHWKRNAEGKWDRGYQDTGYFLDWIEKTKGTGSVLRLNQRLAGEKYKEDVFWKELFGEDVGALFKRYKDVIEKAGEVAKRYGDPRLKMAVRVKSGGGTTEEAGFSGSQN